MKNWASFLLLIFYSNSLLSQKNENEFLYDFVVSEQKVKSCIVEYYSKDPKSDNSDLVLEKNKYPFFDKNNVMSLYSKEGKKIKEIKNDEKGKLIWSTDYTYNSNGRIAQILEINPKKKLRWKSVFKYDAKGNRTEYRELMGDSAVYVYTTYKFDTAGLKIEKEEQVFDSIRKKMKTIFYYDSLKNNVKKEIYLLDKFSKEIHSKYEKKVRTDKFKTLVADTFYDQTRTPIKIVGYEFDNNRLIAEIVMGLNGEEKEKESIRYEYEFDDNDNWIELKKNKGDVLIQRIVRKIEYYPDANE